MADVDICNLALARIGQRQFLTSLGDTSVEAQLCTIAYPFTRDAVLADFPWPFATTYAALAQLVTVRPGWAFEYAAPVGLIRVLSIFSGARPGGPVSSASPLSDNYLYITDAQLAASISRRIPYAVELSDDGSGRVILTDQPLASIAYVAQVTNTNAFPPLFTQALAWKLAGELALSLPVKRDVFQMCEQRYEMQLQRAGAQAFNEQAEDRQPDSEFVNVRG